MPMRALWGWSLSAPAVWKPASVSVSVAAIAVLCVAAVPADLRGQAPRPEAPGVSGAADARLVGTWQYAQSDTSGDVSSYNLSLLPDGHFLHVSDGVQGGGSAGSPGSPGPLTNRGRWRTEDDVLLINEGAGWQPYARFVVEAQLMMLIFGDDRRQLWQRIAY